MQYPLYLLPYGNVADDYDYFLGRYCYFSDQVKAQETFQMSLKDFKACLAKYDYVMLPVKHQTWQKLYHRNFVPGIYKVNKNNLVKVGAVNPLKNKLFSKSDF